MITVGSRTPRGGGWLTTARTCMSEHTTVVSVSRSTETVRRYVQRFLDQEVLVDRIVTVLLALDEPALRDFVDDPRFRIAIDEIVPGRGRTVWLSCPQPGGKGSRSVVLKRRLIDAEPSFAHYVIAHELAHAYLRNGPWGEVKDPEEAADALAAAWGFPRP